jgi:hypothetical protein
MKRYCLVLACGLLFSNFSYAERGDAMMAWPHLVQMDFDAFHVEVVKICTDRYPETSLALKADLLAWKNKNSESILELRRRLKPRFMALNAFSEEVATKEIEQRGKAVTAKYMQVISSFKDEAWNESCHGQYAAVTLKEMDFVSFLPEVTPFIPRLTSEYVFPIVEGQ